MMFAGTRFKKMMNDVLESNNPEEVHDLFTEFLGDDFEKEGTVKYRSINLRYYVGHTSHNKEVIFELVLSDNADRNEGPVLELRMRLKRDNMKDLYNDVKAMIRMVH